MMDNLYNLLYNFRSGNIYLSMEDLIDSFSGLEDIMKPLENSCVSDLILKEFLLYDVQAEWQTLRKFNFEDNQIIALGDNSRKYYLSYLNQKSREIPFYDARINCLSQMRRLDILSQMPHGFLD